MSKIKLTKKELRHIQNRYSVPAVELNLAGSWVDELKSGEQLLKEYHQLIRQFKSWELNISKVKELFAKYLPSTNDYTYNFKYTFTKKTGHKVLMEKQDFLLKLGGKIPDATVLVPFKIIRKF